MNLICLAALTLAPDSPEALEFFEAKIRPIFIAHCHKCHSADAGKREGGLRVDSREDIRRGGDTAPAVVPGDLEKSLLLSAVKWVDKDLRMPPDKKLSAAQIADLETWIRSGAADPRNADPGSAPRPKYGMSLEDGRKFWSFQPVADPPIPAVKNPAWVATSVDAFILDRLEKAGVAPAPQADKRTLIRRATFDLTGLPPTPAEVDAFLADDSPTAFEKVVDRLLASPRYGRRWGRHWLDVVRYSDTSGNASDYPVPQAHRYRDWVIEAFNRDLPYDRFLREQIAGDLLTGPAEGRNDRTIATGYLAIARRFGGDRKGEHHLTIEDTIDNLGKAILGSSISCARCHDHKFDAFTMGDYYGLYGIFESTRYPFPGAEVGRRQEDFVALVPPPELQAQLDAHRTKAAELDAEVKTLADADAALKKEPDGKDKKARAGALAKNLADAKKRSAAHAGSAPVFNAYAVAEGAAPADTKTQLRGDPKRLGDVVPRRFPAVLGGQTLGTAKGSGRLQLADWVADAKNPLTARVMVNRIWQHHFGKGIVQTPNDFGVRGRAPTHPELLDHLASRFIASGWSIKAMHKLILLSHTWRQSGADSPQGIAVDPGNDLFRKQQRRRLDAESLRDTLLFVGGSLDESAAPEHPFPAQSTWNWTQHNPFVAVYETRRRSVYLMQQRIRKNVYLALFDGADPSSSTGVRLPSTTPLQALFLMNDPLAHREADAFAARLIAAAGDETARLTLAYAIAFNRAPDSDERVECAGFLSQYRAKLFDLKTPPAQLEGKTWSALARALLGSNEFVYVD